MNKTSIKNQSKNYINVFKHLMGTYYNNQKRDFWLVQVLMALSVGLGLVWILGLIAGLNNLHDLGYLQTHDIAFLKQFFALPVWLWLSILSVCGLLGTLTMFMSFQVGVRSVIAYQKYLVEECLRLTDDPEKSAWINCFNSEPRANLHRVIKLGIQLVGLVARRISRMLIPVLTFVIAFFALIKLNAILLAFLFPLATVYIIVLYFINRNAARNQIKLSKSAAICGHKMGQLIDQTLDEKILSSKVNIQNLIEETTYHEFTTYRYKRRLAEVHVNWLNGGFLVLGSALLIAIFEWARSGLETNWMSLILFLVALKYAAGSLQQIASATVGFSRFLPETERVFRLLNANRFDKPEKLDGVYFYLSSDTTIKPFKLQVLSKHFLYDDLMLLDEVVDKNIQIQPARVLLVSNQPKRFFNQVKRHSTIIKKIIVEYPEGLIHYDDVSIFLNKFDVEQFIQNQYNQSVEIDDI